MSSNPYFSRVQQKLSHSRLLLNLCQTATQSQEQQALLESCVVSLAISMRLYFRELGHNLSYPMPERLFTLEDLISDVSGGVGVEELSAQESVVSILAAEKAILNPSVGAGQMIGSSAVFSPSDLDRRLLLGWLSSVEELIERQRQSFLEY
ncbi:MAG: hypothetical protein CL693_19210 [Cellvibrionaceae bacterium]|nr:hypothetical protein [Cellvibrionaceae bacterium]|tara:strand:- start:82175 stop:82627 length:453 start_codon:yes stop_codon:yes gene_type:complete